MTRTLLTLLLVTGLALAQGHTKRIQFMAGASGTRIEDAVARGEQNTYLIDCGAGQTMSISVKSTEQNAVFQVFAPGGAQLGEDENTAWTLKLPKKGDYKIVVGATRGGADYVLQVSVK